MIEAAVIGFAVFAGTAADGLGGPLGGISALRWDAPRNELVALSDRGPGDGTVPYAPRVHFFSVSEENGLSLSLKRSVLLLDEKGEPFTGLIVTTISRIDPEGLAVAGDGSLYVSEEYGPDLFHFARDGRLLGRVSAPPQARPGQKSGRVDNRGLEGLCLSPDGKRLAAVLQSPLKQDGGKTGAETRLWLYALPLMGAPPGEYRVAMPRARRIKPEEFAYNACEALEDGSYLLLERDNRGLGEKGIARYKRISRIVLNADGTTKRTPWLDLIPLLKKAGFPAKKLPAKFESIAFGDPKAARKRLWVATDNDFAPAFATYFFLLELR